MRYSALLFLGLALGAHAAMDLTDANFDEEVFNKNKQFVFVKFLAPWCGHCKKLKPDWDKLGDNFNKADSAALIADVDCTQDNAKSLCEKYGVSGYPTIKYFGKDFDKEGEAYDGARDYNALKKFTKQNSKPPCNIETQENCSKKELAYLEEIKEWTPEKLKEELDTFQKSIDESKDKYESTQAEFEKMKDEAIKKMKEAEDLKKEWEKNKKKYSRKLKLLEQKTGGKKDEL